MPKEPFSLTELNLTLPLRPFGSELKGLYEALKGDAGLNMI